MVDGFQLAAFTNEATIEHGFADADIMSQSDHPSKREYAGRKGAGMLHERGVPTPVPYLPRAQWWRRGWLLQEAAEGEQLSVCRGFLTHSEEVVLFRSFGQTVAAMHSITAAVRSYLRRHNLRKVLGTRQSLA